MSEIISLRTTQPHPVVAVGRSFAQAAMCIGQINDLLNATPIEPIAKAAALTALSEAIEAIRCAAENVKEGLKVSAERTDEPSADRNSG